MTMTDHLDAPFPCGHALEGVDQLRAFGRDPAAKGEIVVGVHIREDRANSRPFGQDVVYLWRSIQAC